MIVGISFLHRCLFMRLAFLSLASYKQTIILRNHLLSYPILEWYLKTLDIEILFSVELI